MKYLLSSILLCILFGLLSADSISAQGFNSITTPDGINMVAVGNSGKYYRSGNGGVTYTSFTLAGTPNLNSVTSFGNDVWIAGQNGNVVKTQKTSSPTTTYNVGSSNTLNSIIFINSNTGFTCGNSGSVYKSIDGGLSWSVSNSGIPSIKLNSISFTDASNGTVVGTNGSIYATNTGGSSWVLQASGTTNNLLKVKYFNDSLVAVGEFGTLLLNKGSGWTSVATRTRSDLRSASGTNMNDIHICGGGGFIRNNRSGNIKFNNFEINPMLANLTDIFYYDFNKGWAVSSLNYVIIYTTNGGTTWGMPTGAAVAFNWVAKSPSGGGIGNNLCPHPTDRNSMFVVYGNSVFASRDRSETWTQIATISIGSSCHSFYVSPVDTNIWLAAMVSAPDCIVRSTNYGATWTSIIARDFSTYGQPLEMDQNNPSTFYFAPSNASGEGVYKSVNSGASFSLLAPYNIGSIDQPCDMVVMWDSSNVIYLGDDGAEIYKSTNGAVSWTLVKAGTAAEVPSMCNSVFDKTICYATTWGSSQVFKTLNYGDAWSIISNNSGSGWGSDLCREDPNVVLTGNYGSEAYLTTNGGANFFNINTGLSGAGAGIIVPERGYMLNMQTGNLFKLNITYTDAPILNVIDVQALALGATGVNYYSTSTIIPTGMVKNNNGVASATFIVIRRINPGNYLSTRTITNLAPSSAANVNFDPWTFIAGNTYTVKDSVYINGDTNPANDVLTGTITPYVGQQVLRVGEGFTGTFPPSGWSFQFAGTNYWQYSTASSYGIGVGSAKYDFWNAPNTTGSQSLLSPTFIQSVSGDSLEYDYAYAPYSGSVDSLIIETSSNGGTSYQTLVRLYGTPGATGIYALNTVTSGGNFTPTAGQWLKRKWGIPSGTNKLKFRAVSGFGDNLYLDSIKINSGGLYTQYNVKMALQGMYNGTTLNLKDTVRAFLRSNISPFSKIDSATAVLDSLTLNAAFVFKNAPTGTYYIQIIHRNALETWSKAGGETFTKGITSNYDFTSSQSQSFGNNMIFVTNKWCLYSGDVTRDGAIDLSDIINIYNDASVFASGYIATDLNGDGIVDLSDIIIAFNNSANFIIKITPETSPADIAVQKERMKQEMFELIKKNTENNLIESESKSKNSNTVK